MICVKVPASFPHSPPFLVFCRICFCDHALRAPSSSSLLELVLSLPLFPSLAKHPSEIVLLGWCGKGVYVPPANPYPDAIVVVQLRGFDYVELRDREVRLPLRSVLVSGWS